MILSLLKDEDIVHERFKSNRQTDIWTCLSHLHLTFHDTFLLPGGAVPEEVATQASAAREDTADDWGLPGDKGEEVRGHNHERGQDREEQGTEEEGAEVERDLS